MINGGDNDVFQAVFQSFSCMSSFVRFFISQGHLEAIEETPSAKPMCNLLEKVFNDLYRTNLDVAAPYIDIEYTNQALSKCQSQCAGTIMKYILEMLAAELVPQSIIQDCFSFDRTTDDIIKFHETSQINKQFSFLMYKKFECVMGHMFRIYFSSIGVDMRSPHEGETF